MKDMILQMQPSSKSFISQLVGHPITYTKVIALDPVEAYIFFRLKF